MRQWYKLQSESKGPRTRSDSNLRQEKLNVPAQAESKLALQFSSLAQPCLTLCDPMDCNTPGFPVHHQLPELTQSHVPAVSDAIQQSHFLSPLLPLSIFPSIRVFSNESILHIRSPKYWSFSFNISPSNEYSWLVSCRMDSLSLLTVQETLKSSHIHTWPLENP